MVKIPALPATVIMACLSVIPLDRHACAADQAASGEAPRPAAITPSAAWRGELRVKFKLEHPDSVATVVWSPDGTRIGTVDLANGINVWDAKTGHQIFRVRKRGFLDNSMAFTADGKFVIVKALTNGMADRNGMTDRLSSLSVLDAATGEPVRTLEGPLPSDKSSAPLVFALSPDGRYLAMTPDGDLSLVLVYDTSTWTIARHDHIPPGPDVMAISPDGKTLALTSYDGAIRFCAIPNLACEKPFQAFPSDITALAFSPDGKMLVAGINWGFSGGPGMPGQSRDVQKQIGEAQAEAQHQKVRGFDFRSHKLVGVVEGEFPSVTALAFHPDGEIFAAAVGPGPAGFIIDSRHFSIIRKVTLPTDHVKSVAFSPTGDALAFGSFRTLTVMQPEGSWDATDRSSLQTVSSANGVASTECTARLKEFVSELDQLFDNEPPSLVPILALLNKYFPLKSCDIAEALRICRESKHLTIIEEHQDLYVVVFDSRKGQSSGYNVQFGLLKSSGDSHLPFAKVNK